MSESCAPAPLARIIPRDSMPLSARGFRFTTTTTFRPGSCSGVKASAMPLTMVRGVASPSSTSSLSSLSALATFSAERIRPALRLTFAKSANSMGPTSTAGGSAGRPVFCGGGGTARGGASSFSFSQESFSDTVRLKTGAPAFESASMVK